MAVSVTTTNANRHFGTIQPIPSYLSFNYFKVLKTILKQVTDFRTVLHCLVLLEGISNAPQSIGPARRQVCSVIC